MDLSALQSAVADIASSVEAIRPQFEALSVALDAVPAPAERTPDDQSAIDMIRASLSALLDVSTDAVRNVALFRLDA